MTEQVTERRFEAEYKIKGWKLADAFRPNPNYGRGYLKGKDEGQYTDQQLLDDAKATVPAGYELWSLTQLTPVKREIWRRKLDGTEGFVSAEEAAPA